MLAGTGSNNGSMQFVGGLSAINAALNGMTYRGITNFNGVDALSLQINDGGNTGSGGPLLASSSISMVVSAVNGAPQISAPVPQSSVEESPLIFASANGNSISINDSDAGSSSIKVSLTSLGGTLTLAGNSGLVIVTSIVAASGSTLTFTGSQSDVNTALDGLRYDGLPNFSGNGSLDIFVSDMGNTGSGGTLTDNVVVPITVAGVNDAPLIVAPAGQSIQEGASLMFSSASGNGIVVSDVDAGAAPIQITLTADDGVLSLAQLTGLSLISGTGSADVAVTVQGTYGAITSALDGLRYDANSNFAGVSTIHLTVDDLGNAGSGGALSTTTNITLNVTAVNQPPVLSLPALQSLAEDSALVLSASNGNPITLTDIDSSSTPLRIRLSADHGLLTLAASNLTFNSGTANGTAFLDVSGNLADLQTALANVAVLGASDFFGPLTIAMIVDDLGGAGVGNAVSVGGTLSVDVAAINDAPILLNNQALDLVTQAQLIVGNTDLAVADVDTAATALIYTITQTPSGVELALSGRVLAVGDTFSQADIDAGRLSAQRLGTGAVSGALLLDVSDGAGGQLSNLRLDLKTQTVVAGSATGAAAGAGSVSGSGSNSSSSSSGSSSSGSSSGSSTSSSGTANNALSNPIAPASSATIAGSTPTATAAPRTSAPGSAPPLLPANPANGNTDRSGAGHQRNDSNIESQSSVGRDNARGEVKRSDMLQFDSRRSVVTTAPMTNVQQHSGATVLAPFRKQQAQEQLGQVRERVGERLVADRNFAASSAAVSASVSIGYVIWLIRGGVLLSSVLASVPAWSAIDPLPVLSRVSGRKGGDDEDDSLQAMLSKAKASVLSTTAPNVPNGDQEPTLTKPAIAAE